MMNRRKLSHVIAAGLLVGLVAVPGPVGARGVNSGRAVSPWQWLASLWQYKLAALLQGMEGLQKEGPGIDPNGGKPVSGGSTGLNAPADGTEGSVTSGDAGPGIDPNGR